MNIKELEKNFKNPSVEWRGKPFWSWNGELTKEELNRQVAVMKEMGFGGYFMHSRSGLLTEYLGKEWFELIRSTAEEGDRLDMESWLYDEDRWPSGSAGGLATEEHKYRMKAVLCYEIPLEKYLNNDYTTDGEVLYKAEAYLEDVLLYGHRALTEKPFEGFECNKGEKKILVFTVREDLPESNYNGNTYLDTMNYEATQKFIELTHEKYAETCGDMLGTSIRGIFTDEPHRGALMGERRENNGTFVDRAPWTNDLAVEFEKRYGYDLIPLLPDLFHKTPERNSAKVKINYIDLTNDLFIERFAIPYKKWCDDHNIAFTGHVLHEDSLSLQTGPNGSLMRFYEHMNIPGIDVLAGGDQCWWNAKQIDSAAKQTGKEWILSELYGCTGWQTNFRDYKYLGDWQAFFGVNLRCPHLSWYTMEGEAKRDFPASILHQSTFYRDFNHVETYFARFGMFMNGKPLCDTLVINPIESLWSLVHSGWANWIFPKDEDCIALDNKYAKLFNLIEGNHIDFDYGEEQMMSRLASVESRNGEAILKIGNCEYRTVILGGMLTVRKTTLDLLKKFADLGGKVIFTGDEPYMVDGEISDECKKFASTAVKCSFDGDAIAEAMGRRTVSIKADGKEAEKLFGRIIDYGDGNFGLAILNTDRENSFKNVEITVNTSKTYIEEWDLETAEKYLVGEGSTIITDVEAAGVKTYVLTDTDNGLTRKTVTGAGETKFIQGEFDYTLDEKNVFVLDYCSWREENKEWSPECEVLKCDRQIRDLYGIEYRGGEMCQPWFTKLYQNKHFNNIELKYEFFADYTDCDFVLAGERPEYMEYELNGVKLSHKEEDGFWVDIAFKKMPIPKGLIKKGKNVLTVKTKFMTLTNIEALYIIGDFGVKLEGTKKEIVKMPEKLAFGNIEKYDLPFYSGVVSYIIPKADLPKVNDGQRALITVDDFKGALVKVNGRIIAWEPYTLDITEELKKEEDLTVSLVCTRRNTFGPLHIFPALRSAVSPSSFVTSGREWKDEYMLLDSGINAVKITVE